MGFKKAFVFVVIAAAGVTAFLYLRRPHLKSESPREPLSGADRVPARGASADSPIYTGVAAVAVSKDAASLPQAASAEMPARPTESAAVIPAVEHGAVSRRNDSSSRREAGSRKTATYETGSLGPGKRQAAGGGLVPEEKAVAEDFRVLFSSGSYMRFRENDPQWIAKYRVASFDSALRENGAALSEDQIEPLTALFSRYAGSDEGADEEATAVSSPVEYGERVEDALSAGVTSTAKAYDEIYEAASKILDERQMVELELFLESDLMRKEADAVWLRGFLEGLRSIEGSSVVVTVDGIIPGAFGLPVGGVGVEVDGRAVDLEALPPVTRGRKSR